MKNANIKTVSQGCFSNTPVQTAIIGENKLSRKMFANCDYLVNVSFSGEMIPQAAFQNCSSLQTVNAPFVTTISYLAFYHCPRLRNIDFPLLQRIEAGAFAFCNKLKSITTETLSYIGIASFYNCTSLEQILLPANVKLQPPTKFRKMENEEWYHDFEYFGWGLYNSDGTPIQRQYNSDIYAICEQSIFGYCINLKKIYSLITQPTAINDKLFFNVPKDLVTLYVPNVEDIVETYQMTLGWNEFKNIEPFDYISNITSPLGVADSLKEKYNLQGIKIDIPQPGSIYIQGGRKRIAP